MDRFREKVKRLAYPGYVVPFCGQLSYELVRQPAEGVKMGTNRRVNDLSRQIGVGWNVP